MTKVLTRSACWLCAALGGCTPISPANTSTSGHRAGSSSRGAAPAADGGSSPNDASTALAKSVTTGRGQMDEGCKQEGARVCTPGNPSRQPLSCVDGVWHAEPMCNEGQRCEPADGPAQGMCVMIDRACIGRTPGEKFCDRDSIRACEDGLSSIIETCDADKRCVKRDDEAACECAASTIEVAGECQQSMSCSDGQGGCDPQTRCSMDGANRTCSPCPAGYAGTGLTGCSPVLLALELDADAQLSPPLAPNVRSLRVQLPLIRQQLTLTPKVAAGVEVEINGTKLAADASWRSNVLSLGEHPIGLTLNAPNSGLTTRYDLLIARSGVQEAFIKAAQPDQDDTFGFALALSGDTLAVGAPSEDGAVGGVNGDQRSNAAAESGAAYIFVRAGSTWQQQAYLKPDKPQTGQYFGGGIALDGDTLLVGAPRDSPYPNPNESAPARAGVVYAFTRSNGVWSQQAVIESPSSSSDLFGSSIAMNRDTIVIGAPYDASDGNRNSGAIYMLARDGQWGPLTRVKPKQSVGDAVFGWSLALGPDALLVGAPEKSLVAQRAGKVFTYVKTSAGWQQRQTLLPASPQDGLSFGWSVALDGDMAAVGAPFASLLTVTPHGEAYVYQRSADTWQLTATLTADTPRDSDYFGSAVALTGDDLLIAASGDSSGSSGLLADSSRNDVTESGAVYMYGQQNTQWVRSTFIKTSNPAPNVMVGQGIALSGDTFAVSGQNESSASGGVNTAPAGTASGSGAVYVFR